MAEQGSENECEFQTSLGVPATTKDPKPDSQNIAVYCKVAEEKSEETSDSISGDADMQTHRISKGERTTGGCDVERKGERSLSEESEETLSEPSDEAVTVIEKQSTTKSVQISAKDSTPKTAENLFITESSETSCNDESYGENSSYLSNSANEEQICKHASESNKQVYSKDDAHATERTLTTRSGAEAPPVTLIEDADSRTQNTEHEASTESNEITDYKIACAEELSTSAGSETVDTEPVQEYEAVLVADSGKLVAETTITEPLAAESEMVPAVSENMAPEPLADPEATATLVAESQMFPAEPTMATKEPFAESETVITGPLVEMDLAVSETAVTEESSEAETVTTLILPQHENVCTEPLPAETAYAETAATEHLAESETVSAASETVTTETLAETATSVFSAEMDTVIAESTTGNAKNLAVPKMVTEEPLTSEKPIAVYADTEVLAESDMASTVPETVTMETLASELETPLTEIVTTLAAESRMLLAEATTLTTEHFAESETVATGSSVETEMDFAVPAIVTKESLEPETVTVEHLVESKMVLVAPQTVITETLTGTETPELLAASLMLLAKLETDTSEISSETETLVEEPATVTTEPRVQPETASKGPLAAESEIVQAKGETYTTETLAEYKMTLTEATTSETLEAELETITTEILAEKEMLLSEPATETPLLELETVTKECLGEPKIATPELLAAESLMLLAELETTTSEMLAEPVMVPTETLAQPETATTEPMVVESQVVLAALETTTSEILAESETLLTEFTMASTNPLVQLETAISEPLVTESEMVEAVPGTSSTEVLAEIDMLSSEPATVTTKPLVKSETAATKLSTAGRETISVDPETRTTSFLAVYKAENSEAQLNESGYSDIKTTESLSIPELEMLDNSQNSANEINSALTSRGRLKPEFSTNSTRTKRLLDKSSESQPLKRVALSKSSSDFETGQQLSLAISSEEVESRQILDSSGSTEVAEKSEKGMSENSATASEDSTQSETDAAGLERFHELVMLDHGFKDLDGVGPAAFETSISWTLATVLSRPREVNLDDLCNGFVPTSPVRIHVKMPRGNYFDNFADIFSDPESYSEYSRYLLCTIMFLGFVFISLGIATTNLVLCIMGILYLLVTFQ